MAHQLPPGLKLTPAQRAANHRARKAGKPPPFASHKKTWTDDDRRAYHREYSRKRTAADPVFAARVREANRLSAFRRRYGFDQTERDARVAAQDGRCAICPVVLTDWRKAKATAAVVDHDHATGKVRGILCNQCNRAIGLLGDSAERLESAAAYLRSNI